jgi:prepilin-type processing-associated H-X9-DG protein
MIELLVVLAIFGLLLALILTSVQKVRNSASRVNCQNNLRNIGLALQSYHDKNGQLPPKKSISRSDPNKKLGWMTLILLEMGEAAAYDSAVAACANDSLAYENPPHTMIEYVVRSYVCPEDTRLFVPHQSPRGFHASFTSYIGSAGAVISGQPPRYLHGVLGGFEDSGIRLNEIRDGLSNTSMLFERPPPDTYQAGLWYTGYYAIGGSMSGPNIGLYLGGFVINAQEEPCRQFIGTIGPGRISNPCDRFHVWSLHSQGANALMADGSVHFLNYSIGDKIFALASRSEGDKAELE